jgi:gliding motility-associated protein GldL
MTSENNNDFVHKFYKVIMPKIYGIGASIVIFGAMFKLLNWAGGAFMLGLGLTTEAIIFILSSFEPQEQEVDWTRAYPELKEDYVGPLGVSRQQGQSAESISGKLDELFAQAKIDGALIDKLGNGMKSLAESTQHIASLTHTAQATQQFTIHLERASENLENIYEAQSGLLQAMKQLDGLAQYTQGFHEGLQNITETLGRANAMYTTELQDVNQRLEGTKTAYASLTETIYQLQTASSQTENFRAELAALNEKLSSLNNVYGNMLIALKS